MAAIIAAYFRVTPIVFAAAADCFTLISPPFCRLDAAALFFDADDIAIVFFTHFLLYAVFMLLMLPCRQISDLRAMPPPPPLMP